MIIFFILFWENQNGNKRHRNQRNYIVQPEFK
jgi:hypothetical protein